MVAKGLVVGGFAALVLAVGVAGASALPPAQKARIHALLAPYDFYPARLPNGLIFINFKETHPGPSVCGPAVTIRFAAAGGKEIDWASSRDCNGAGKVSCNPTGYPGRGGGFGIGYGSRRATINHRRVFFSAGNHGSNAWACIPLKVGGYRDWAVVGIWESNFISRKQAMRLVAFAAR